MELVSLLSDERLGTWQEIYRPLLFEEKGQSMTINLLTDLGRIKREDLVKMIEEMDRLLPRMHPMIKFIDDHLILDHDISLDAIESIKTLRRMSDSKNMIWKKNKDVLDVWISIPED